MNKIFSYRLTPTPTSKKYVIASDSAAISSRLRQLYEIATSEL